MGIGHTLNLINKLGNSTAHGNDGIDAIALKAVAEDIAAPLNYIINLSIQSATFANKWKIGKVIPLWKGKGKDKLEPSSYRPVSMLPTVSKLVEKSVQEQIVRHMEGEHLWNTNHHAYKINHSTTTALSQLTDMIFEAGDRNEIAVAMSIDESAAFDCINHSVLSKKLDLYNFSATTKAWIKSYLDYRSQFISIGAHRSSFKNIKCGIPQGSILGPTIFNIYVNKLPDIVNDFESCSSDAHESTEYLFNVNCRYCGGLPCYADDAVYYVSSKSREWNQDRIKVILDRLTVFLNANYLTVNKSKTVLQEFMLKQKRCKINGSPPQLTTFLENGDVKIVHALKSCNSLGGTLQNDLQWREHIETGENSLLSAVRKKLGALKYLGGGGIPRKSKLMLANGLILSKILYLLPLYGGTQIKYLRKIQVTMNNTIRFVTGMGRRTSTLTLMREVNWLTIQELTELHSLLFIWRTIHLKTPHYLAGKILLNETDNTISTNIPRLMNTTTSLRWRIVQIWNALDQDIRQERSYSKFKTAVRRGIMNRRPPT